MEFDGQQSGERVLTTITPHISRFLFSGISLTIAFIAVVTILFAIANFVPTAASAIKIAVIIIALIVILISLWWMWKTQKTDKTYITDRRIIRFDVVSPFFTNKRALFWNEVLKTKAYAPNMVMRLLKVGTLQVEPVAAEQESIVITDVYFHEDLANYLDKILFAFKNKPDDIATMKSFIAKSKGKRD
ncbi:MAG: hypothetical protein WAV51_01685 [Microgenomates group bacterium]